MILVTELYDEEKDQRGYYIVNMTDPFTETAIEATVSVKNYGSVQIYNGKEIVNERLSGGSFSYSLAAGKGIFVSLIKRIEKPPNRRMAK